MLATLELVDNLLGSHFLVLRAYCPSQSFEGLIDRLEIDLKVANSFTREVFV